MTQTQRPVVKVTPWQAVREQLNVYQCPQCENNCWAMPGASIGCIMCNVQIMDTGRKVLVGFNKDGSVYEAEPN